MALRVLWKQVLLALLLSAGWSHAAELGEWYGATVRVDGDFIGGYFHDDALEGSAGRESQAFKMSRGLIGLDIQHGSGWGGLLEYNVFPDEAKRDGDKRINYDWYNNLGTDLYFFGDFKVRNGYLRYITPTGRWVTRAGRMVNIVGFEENEVPFWGRVDSPHAHFLTKEILNGVAVAYDSSWLRLEAAVLSGQGRPDRDYNWYLNGATDPNISGNSDVIFEGEAILRWREFLSLSIGYHEGKTGSAPGSIFSGKHNDDRLVYGLRTNTRAFGRYRFRLLLLGQYSDFTIGLTEDGQQGVETPTESMDLDKHGWFVTGGFSLFDRASLYVTYEELDRIDSNIWSNVAQYDPAHWAFDSVERSTIVHADFQLNRWVSLYGFYRFLDFDFGQWSQISSKIVTAREFDRYGLVLRVKF